MRQNGPTSSFRRHRLAAGLTQRAAAAELGVSVSSICEWESTDRNPAAGLYPKIAELFGITSLEAVDLFDAAEPTALVREAVGT